MGDEASRAPHAGRSSASFSWPISGVGVLSPLKYKAPEPFGPPPLYIMALLPPRGAPLYLTLAYVPWKPAQGGAKKGKRSYGGALKAGASGKWPVAASVTLTVLCV